MSNSRNRKTNKTKTSKLESKKEEKKTSTFKPKPTDVKRIESLLEDLSDQTKASRLLYSYLALVGSEIVALALFFNLRETELNSMEKWSAMAAGGGLDQFIKSLLKRSLQKTAEKEIITLESEGDVIATIKRLEKKLLETKFSAHFFFVLSFSCFVLKFLLEGATSKLDKEIHDQFSAYTAAFLVMFLMNCVQDRFLLPAFLKSQRKEHTERELEVIKAQCLAFTSVIPSEAKPTCEFVPAKNSKNSYYAISLQKKYKHLSFSETAQAIKNVFLHHGIIVTSVDHANIFLNVSAKMPADSSQLAFDIEATLMSLNETKLIAKQISEIAKIMEVESDYEPCKAEQNTYRYKYLLKVPDAYLSVINTDILKKLFRDAEVSVTDKNYFTIMTSRQANTDQLVTVERSLEEIRNKENKKAIPQLEEKANAEEQGLKVVKSKEIEEQARPRTDDSTQNQTKAKKTTLTWPSKAVYDPADENCPVKLIEVPEKNSRPPESLFYIWEVPSEYLTQPNAEKAFKASAGKLAEARRGRQGLITLDGGEEVKTDNKGKVSAWAKVKRLETFGDMSIFASKKEDIVHEGKTRTLYHLDAVKDHTHIKF